MTDRPVSTSGTTPEPIQVWMHEALVPSFVAWLESRNLHLFGPMTFDPDDEPQHVHMVGIGPHPSKKGSAHA